MTAPTSTGTDPSTATPPEPTTTTTATPSPSDPTETVEHWKEMARKQEQRAKDNAAAAKKLEQLEASMMSDTEKAVTEAKEAGKAEGLRAGATKIAQAEIRAAAAGRSVDVDALLEGVDAAKFVGDDGEVDRKAITAWVDRVAPAGEPGARPPLDLGQGARGTGGQQSTGDPSRDFATFIQDQLK